MGLFLRSIERRAAAAVAAVILLLACAGCSSTGAGRVLSSSPASAQVSPVPTRGSNSAGLQPSPPPLLTEADTAGAESTPWKATSSSGRSLTLRYIVGGGCQQFKGLRVLQTPKAVEIWSVVTTDHAAQACIDALYSGTAIVTLDRPIGTRLLLHAPVSKQWRKYAYTLG